MREYRGLIFTNHALTRLRERGISQGDAWATWHNPDKSRYAKAKGAWVYYKKFPGTRIEVVAKQNDRNEWLVLSVWSKDAYGQKPPKPNLFIRMLKRILLGGR